MLDPSILVSPGTHHSPVSAVVPDAQGATELAQAESRTWALAAAIEILSVLDATENLDEAAYRAARSLCELLTARRVLILWRRRSGDVLSVISDSNEVSCADGTNHYRMAIAAGEEIAARAEITQWPPRQAGDRLALMAVAQLAQDLKAESLCGVCLPDSLGHVRGVMLAINPANAAATNFLGAIGLPLASKLMGIERLQRTSLQRVIRNVLEMAQSSRGILILSLAILLGLVMMLPLQYRIGAELELQPIKQRFIAVPIGGSLESAHVRPGDLVQQGDLLARINPREIEYELAGIRAALSRAVQEKKGLMAKHDFAGSKIAALESDRLQLQSDLLQYRRDNLEIRSPIAGIVVSGDLKQSEGMPMSRGETLFEIAPLGEMVVEIAVREIDIAHVRKGMNVDFFVHALPSHVMRGTIARLHPRAQLRNHENVYIAEVRVSDPDNILRPGMRGRARISSTRHPLGWNLFHKSYFALRRAMSW